MKRRDDQRRRLSDGTIRHDHVNAIGVSFRVLPGGLWISLNGGKWWTPEKGLFVSERSGAHRKGIS